MIEINKGEEESPYTPSLRKLFLYTSLGFAEVSQVED